MRFKKDSRYISAQKKRICIRAAIHTQGPRCVNLKVCVFHVFMYLGYLNLVYVAQDLRGLVPATGAIIKYSD